MAKRGRKKKPGPRQPNGQLRRGKDYGTPELMEKRMRAVGGGDPVLSEYMLGRLYSRGAVNLDHKNAGLRFASLYQRRVRVARFEKGLSFDGSRAGHDPSAESDEDIRQSEQIKAAYTAARAVLQAHSRQTLDAVTNCCCYERAPSSPERLVIGLDLLAGHFGLMERRAA
jgi:hypothetical protein